MRSARRDIYRSLYNEPRYLTVKHAGDSILANHHLPSRRMRLFYDFVLIFIKLDFKELLHTKLFKIDKKA